LYDPAKPFRTSIEQDMKKPSISKEEFATFVKRTQVPLPAHQQADIYDMFGLVEDMVARLHTPLPRHAELAPTFKVEED
jgi:hypothetical protein